MKLYELTDAYQNLLEAIEDEEQEVNLADTLESIEEAIDNKVENIAKLIKTMDAQAKVLKEEEARLSARRKMLEARMDGLKRYTLSTLEQAGLTKVKGAIFTVGIRNNRPSVVVDESELPAEFLIPQPLKPDKQRLYELLKDGQVITGARLEVSHSLSIR
ncbi:siphovirus Gp157 family protein [Aneurinibacillus migulanus]|uniref:siphovirus Gp157 family protein n=1 Tax=Aneurinibacillus migulanus TaxID=47500 RepID=UPI00209D9287|nr:siphovirus Gp157 family protein [Aneurinibacillus migulanus]MCP1355513.1 siphovirus Gp157 family protein [Aneurinibacillus migulanus]